MRVSSGSGLLWLCLVLGIRGLVGFGCDGLVNAVNPARFAGGSPRASRNRPARPLLDPLADVVPWALLPAQVLREGRGRDSELLGSGDLVQPLRPEELSEELGSVVRGHSWFRFMNQVSPPVKDLVKIHARERGTMQWMAKQKPGGRERDEAISWYCHMRLKKMIDEGVEQKKLARRAAIPASGLNALIKRGIGFGLPTASAFTGILGFETRGQFVDAADAWYQREGARYVGHAMKIINAEQAAKQEAKAGKQQGRIAELERELAAAKKRARTG